MLMINDSVNIQFRVNILNRQITSKTFSLSCVVTVFGCVSKDRKLISQSIATSVLNCVV